MDAGKILWSFMDIWKKINNENVKTIKRKI